MTLFMHGDHHPHSQVTTLVTNNDDDFDKDSENVPINGTKVFDLWVLDESTHEWERISIEILHWEETVGDKQFYFKGTIGETELVFAQNSYGADRNDDFVLYYGTGSTTFRKFMIPGVVRKNQTVRTYLDHIDSLYLM
ncbi:putative F-box protein At1g70970 [Capsella rubella]|uniref:putative F-box protein At1g70970 n=1 Tax=Capsella rubella TaxID=81985 RepID=UPI000CD501E3|nr:putative F-box protein At1g70970 [Capsella rubella]